MADRSNLTEALLSAAERSPDRLALRVAADSGAPDDWTYGRLHASAAGFARQLREHGVEPGDRVVSFLGNRPEFVAAYLAILHLGAALVPMNLAYRRSEISHVLGDAEPRLILTDRAHREILEETLRQSADEPRILSIDALRQDDPLEEPYSRALSADAPALILYTSGTTGPSKGAVLSHRNVLATVRSLHQAWAWSADDVLLLSLPLFHTHGLVVGLHCALAMGATTCLHTRFNAERVLSGLLTGEPTLFFGVPTMYVRLLEAMRRHDGDLDLAHVRLFCCGSAPLDPEVFTEFLRLTGHSILERYGMTETGMLLSNPYTGPRLPGTVGRELPGVEARVVADDDRDLPAAQEGELLVRGDNVFSGYWRAPDKTRESFAVDADGRRWFRTGDLARRDAESGFYTLLGRRHELIISGGFNVYPREVEEVLTLLPGIREAAVVGRPHPEWGEEVVAFVVADEPFDPAATVESCKRHMAAFKAPRRLHRLESLPRNALGKVQKHLLPGDGS